MIRYINGHKLCPQIIWLNNTDSHKLHLQIIQWYTVTSTDYAYKSYDLITLTATNHIVTDTNCIYKSYDPIIFTATICIYKSYDPIIFCPLQWTVIGCVTQTIRKNSRHFVDVPSPLLFRSPLNSKTMPSCDVTQETWTAYKKLYSLMCAVHLLLLILPTILKLLTNARSQMNAGSWLNADRFK